MEMLRAAGIIYVHQNQVLLLKRIRGNGVDMPATWAFPGGKLEANETPEEAARRESLEEIGYSPKSILQQIDFTQKDGVEFTTFLCSGEFFNPVLNSEHCGYVWAGLNDLPSPMHPGAAGTLMNFMEKAQALDSARQVDNNGFTLIDANPISRSGVFQYLGRHLPGADEPDRVYNVYRPDEELADPAAIDSFKLIPIVDDHTMLGSAENGLTPAESKGVHGSTGDKISFKDGVLYSNLKIFSQTLTNMVQSGKRDLSLGYRCVYEKVAGIFNGQQYDYIQRKLRGNHLALVEEARCDVQVLDQHMAFDHFDLALDKEEKEAMADENKDDDTKKDDSEKKAKDESEGSGKGEMTLKEAHSMMKQVVPMIAKMQEMLKTLGGAEEEEMEKEAIDPATDGDMDKDKAKDDADFDPTTEKDATTGTGKGVTDEDDKEKGKAMDSAVKKLSAEIAEIKRGNFKAVMREVAERDTLANRISEFVGTFDSRDKTLQEVAEYGVEKLGIKCIKGHEMTALDGFFHNRRPNTVGFGLDSGSSNKPGKFSAWKEKKAS